MPIVSFVNLLNAVISITLAWRLSMRRRSDKQNQAARYFVWFFTAFGVMWFLYGLEGVVSTDIAVINRTNMLADLTLYVASTIGIQIAFIAMNRREYGLLAAAVYLTFGFVYLFLRLGDPGSYQLVEALPYVYWEPTFSPLLQAITGLVASSASVIFAITFLVQGLRNRKNTKVFRRSLYLAAGMTCILLASLLFFVTTRSSFAGGAMAAIFSGGGLGLIYHVVVIELSLHLPK